MGIVYDSGNYEAALDKLLEHIDAAAVKREAEELRPKASTGASAFSTYTEICGNAPSRAVGPSALGLQAGGWESATVRVHRQRLGHALYGHVAARPGPRDRASPRSSPNRLGVDPSMVDGDPRRHPTQDRGDSTRTGRGRWR